MFGDQTAAMNAYLELFRTLAAGGEDEAAPRAAWARIAALEREDDALTAPYLRRALGLAAHDFLLAMLAFAFELDGGLRLQYRQRYGRDCPDLAYGLRLLEPLCPVGCAAVADFAGEGALPSLLLVPAQEDAFVLERPLRLTRMAAAFLADGAAASAPWLDLVGPGEALPLHGAQLARVCAWMEAGGDSRLLLCGRPGTGRRTLLRRAAQTVCGTPLPCVDLDLIAALPFQEAETARREAGLLARLLGAPLCLTHAEDARARALFCGGCARWGVRCAAVLERAPAAPDGAEEALCLPDALAGDEAAAAWARFAAWEPPGEAARYRLSIGALRAAAARAERAAKQAGRPRPGDADLRAAVSGLTVWSGFGTLSEPRTAFDELVLPPAVTAQLRLLCAAAAQRGALRTWGFRDARQGVVAVFHGAPGTGKTMAAAAVAHALGLPLLHADLAGVMDKYVGETEKHLEALFEGARRQNCVLLFDEADALFGKRTEVDSAHDRYANVSTSYLLQKLEDYDGVVLLSTNLLRNFDEAFLRRLRFVVRFPMPDAALRARVWETALPEARRAGLDLALLAQVELSPARIVEAARAAALAALTAGARAVDPPTAARAVCAELEKSGKLPPAAIKAACAAEG